MAGKFERKRFSEINLDDPFFDSLKADYPKDANNIGFENWFAKKAQTGSTALVFDDDEGLGAFVCLKEENEAIALKEGNLPLVIKYNGKSIKVKSIDCNLLSIKWILQTGN